ncbi:orotidine-5'-phosphate decarboxylase [candidate division KSB1 bacterium]
MNFSERIKSIIKKKDSNVCVGLDSDPAKIPGCIEGSEGERILEFNKQIIEATSEHAAAYKFNMAFYEAAGIEGYIALADSIKLISWNSLIILDGKRGDIGNTSAQYAKALFDGLSADAVTVNPYMGFDSVEPFLKFEEKGIFALCLTSNKGSFDFQKAKLENGKPLFISVAEKLSDWNHKGNIGIVVGATHPDELQLIRKILPDSPFLIPGIGAQQGDLEKTVAAGIGKDKAPALINSSRGIIFSSDGEDFAESAGFKSRELKESINNCL